MVPSSLLGLLDPFIHVSEEEEDEDKVDLKTDLVLDGGGEAVGDLDLNERS
jgi:hypothetical protein